MHNFCEGQLFLYRKLGMYHMLLQHYMEHDDFPNILETCQKFGDDDANLWVQALTYFGARLDFPQLYIEQILAQIEQRNLLPPLVVVQILARNRKMPLSIVKAYITRRLRQEKQQIEMDEREIRKLRDDTEKMRTEIAKLKTRCVCFAAVSVLKATAACCTFCVSRSLSLSLSFSPPIPPPFPSAFTTTTAQRPSARRKRSWRSNLRRMERPMACACIPFTPAPLRPAQTARMRVRARATPPLPTLRRRSTSMSRSAESLRARRMALQR